MALVWGFTFVRAYPVRSGGKVIPLAQREEDERFKSGLHHGGPAIKDPGRPEGKDVSLPQSSTSGHLMPRSFCWPPAWARARLRKRVAFSGARTTPPSPPWPPAKAGRGAEHLGVGEVRG